MPDLPIGTVTFLFTDIEGSTRLLQRLGDRFGEVIDEHGRIIREAIDSANGVEVSTEGDAFFAAFPDARAAVAAAVEAQRALAAYHWPEGHAVRVRMGIHTGEGILGGDNYIGLDVHLAARIAAAGHGGQILLSDATRRSVELALPNRVSLRDLGRHRLKDIEQPEHLSDLLIDGLATDFPAIRTLDARPTNLPPQRTSFLGREHEVEEVSAMLGETRILTLTGPGGTGKTRLALKVAADRLDDFPDGVFFVDLSATTDPALVPAVIAHVLVVRDEPGRVLLETIADHLRDRRLLLLLDNVEQVIAAGVAVAQLLDSAPRVTVLATGRVALHISGEREYPVPPLSLPDQVGSGLDLIAGSEAVALFAERAAAVQPGFRLTAGNAAAVAEITARLDGLPLAIELAVSRLNVLTPPALLERLTERLSLLTTGARDLPERQRTLRETIEWSHELLLPGQRELLARLAVFAGGWTLGSAEDVCGPGLEIAVVDGLSALVDANLVRRTERTEDEPRFGMLETIREYATEQLRRSGDEAELRRRHADHFRSLAERHDPGFFFRIAGVGKEQGIRSLQLDLENDNLRAALTWATEEGGDVLTGLRTAASLSWHWQHRGHFADGRRWLERLLSVSDSSVPPAVRVRALLALGDMTIWDDDRSSARGTFQEAVDTARGIEDPHLLAWSLLDLADIPTWEEDYDRAESLLMESLASAEAAGDPELASEVRAVLGRLAYFQGDIEVAGERYREAIAAQREIGTDRFLAMNVARLADVEVQMGELDAAEGHYREFLANVADAGNVVITAIMLVYLAWVAGRRSAHGRAALLLGAASRIRDDAGGGPTRATIPVWPEAEDEARRALGDEAFEEIRSQGYAMSFEEAVASGLEGES